MAIGKVLLMFLAVLGLIGLGKLLFASEAQTRIKGDHNVVINVTSTSEADSDASKTRS